MAKTELDKVRKAYDLAKRELEKLTQDPNAPPGKIKGFEMKVQHLRKRYFELKREPEKTPIETRDVIRDLQQGKISPEDFRLILDERLAELEQEKQNILKFELDPETMAKSPWKLFRSRGIIKRLNIEIEALQSASAIQQSRRITHD